MISKEPKVPILTTEQVEQLTKVVFLEPISPTSYDVIFVFAGTHPGHWEKTIEAYQLGLGKKVIVTGGVSPTGIKHPDWKDKTVPESKVIVSEMINAGIPKEHIDYETDSRHSLENVLNAKKLADFTNVKNMLFICKNHGAGRQYRTLAKNMSAEINYQPYGFDARYNDISVSRDNWMNTNIGRSRVFGEYLRIIHLGKIGHVLPLEEEIDGLDTSL
ncbi:YdcF family protein [Aureibacillus halotolerans]|uniref:DUF218 domain-containing protein n=1 Tax=Aureibacillus halotolerans TaxID=1508390 RepID=A0A4R6U7A5_9BACI|nr:YdcF family protein [Aureibacillus halotolerans]TDQ40783.1 DUF218 domain-containing protein [Aureibacillus halotolerans]